MQRGDEIIVFVPWWTEGKIHRERAKVKSAKTGEIKLLGKESGYCTDFELGRTAFLSEEEALKSCERDRRNWIATLERKINGYKALTFQLIDCVR